VLVTVETRDQDHHDEVVKALTAFGYRVEPVS
jgi:hypothetical protein